MPKLSLIDILSDLRSGRISMKDAVELIDSLPSQKNHESPDVYNEREMDSDVLVEEPYFAIMDINQFAKKIGKAIIKNNKFVNSLAGAILDKLSDIHK